MAFTRLLLQTSCYIVINDIITISSALCFEDISLHFLNYYIFCSSVVLIWCLRSFSVIISGSGVYPRGAEDIWSHIFFQQHHFQFLSTANSCVAFLRRFRHYSLLCHLNIIQLFKKMYVCFAQWLTPKFLSNAAQVRSPASPCGIVYGHQIVRGVFIE